jgi:hypothetical protein
MTGDKWISIEDELAGRSSRTPMQQENYWIRNNEELDIMLKGRDAQLNRIYRDILELHQVVKPEENYSVEMLQQKVVQLRKALKSNAASSIRDLSQYSESISTGGD